MYIFYLSGQTMPASTETRMRDDRMSLLKSQHRPYGNAGTGIPLYGQDTIQPSYEQKHISRSSSLSQTETDKIFCLRQQFLFGVTLIVASSLVVFVLFVTSFR